MKQALCFTVFFLVVFSVCSTHAHAVGFEFAIGGWDEGPSGGLAYEGESLDLQDDNNYDNESRVFGRFKLDMPLFLPNVYLMATPMHFEGEGRKDLAFRFGDRTFSAGADYYSELVLDHYDVALYYGIPALKTATAGILDIEFGLNARIIDFSAMVRQDALMQEESESMTLPLPMGYVGIQVDPLEWLCLEVEGRGIEYSGNLYYDFIGRLKFKPAGPVFVAGGWRSEQVEIEEDDLEVDVEFKGPFLEAGVEF